MYTYCDIGAGLSFPKAVLQYASLLDVKAFEPFDPENRVVGNKGFNSIEIYPFAIGAEDRDDANFYVTKKSACSSLLEPLDSYGSSSLSEKFNVLRTIKVPLRRLDTLFNAGFDLLKIDAQGGGIDVLKGAHGILRTTKVIVVELEFIPLYKDQQLYHEGVRYMKSMGFKLYKIPAIHSLGELGYTYCDAIFVNESCQDIPAELLDIILPEDQQINNRWLNYLKQLLR